MRHGLAKTRREIRKHGAYYVLLLPMIAYFIIWHYIPMYGVTIAFKDYRINDGILGSPWVGLDNFRDLFGAYAFQKVMRNTLLISLYRLVFGFPAPVLFALFLNEIRLGAFKRTVQTISYLPHFISWVVLGSIVTDLLSPSTGVVNTLLGLLGAEPVYFMIQRSMFRSILVATDIWAGVGWSSIIYLSALTSVNVELYEAAYMEGANRLQGMRYITLPAILPVVSIVFILGMGGIMNAGFDQVYNMYNERVYEVADILDTYVYRLGLKEMKYSFASAVGLFKNVVGLMALLLTNFVVRRVGDSALL